MVGGFNLMMFILFDEDLVIILVSAGAGCAAPLVLISGNFVLLI